MEKRYRIEYSKKAIKELGKLDPQISRKITKWLSNHVDESLNPRQYGSPIKGNKAEWRYRVGNYRILVDIYDDKAIIFTLEVGHRKEIYK